MNDHYGFWNENHIGIKIFFIIFLALNGGGNQERLFILVTCECVCFCSMESREERTVPEGRKVTFFYYLFLLNFECESSPHISAPYFWHGIKEGIKTVFYRLLRVIFSLKKRERERESMREREHGAGGAQSLARGVVGPIPADNLIRATLNPRIHIYTV